MQVSSTEQLYSQRQTTQRNHFPADISLKNKQIRELSLRFNELTRENAKLRRTNESLTVQNSDLQQSLVSSERKRQSLKNKLNSKEFPLFANSNQTSEILNYANFLNKRLRESPRIQQIILDRVDSFHSYTGQLSSPEQTQNCLLQTLQIISDLLVEDIVKTSKSCSKHSQTSATHIFRETTKEPTYSPIYGNRSISSLSREEEDQDILLCSINEQSQRVAKLNQQISAAMKSSRRLLYSPLQLRTKECSSKATQ